MAIADSPPFKPTLGTAQDFLHYQSNPLNVIFEPKTVAVIGATEKEGSVGRTVFWNLISNPFGGTVYPINPKRPNVLGVKAYPDVASVPEPVDLAVICTPAPTIPPIVAQCAAAGVKGLIIISAGFKELGPQGLELERQVLEAARGKMRIVGPNCLGVMNPLTGLNATFAAGIARPGNVGFISQSGALCTAILDWSFGENLGFSAFVSIGSMLDVDWGDLIYYLGDDPRTKSIVIYMESIGNARSFLSAAREVALTKPILVIKAGASEAAAKAAASHTGALTGSDEVLSAAFRRCGVLRVHQISDLFHMAEVLAKQPRPRGPHLTILTNAGGPGVLATDALMNTGGQLTQISEETFTALNDLLPPHWSRNNPIDILGDADAGRYARSLEIAAKDESADGMLVILTPQDMTDPTRTAEELAKVSNLENKPVLASWMGGPHVAAGEEILNRASIPTFQYPDMAARMFNYMWRFTYSLRGLYETPHMTDDEFENIDRARAREIIDKARKSGRTLLTEHESKQLLEAYDISTTPMRVAATAEEAVVAATDLGYPVVLKLHSETLTHKTDVGGVELNLADAGAVAEAFRRIETSVKEKAGAQHFLGCSVQPMVKMDGYEIILGSSIDAQFGPVMMFGLGGQLVEVFKDRALAIPPLTTTLARRMMEQTKIYTALKGVRGRESVDMKALEELLVKFSFLVTDQSWIKELDINPLLASPGGLIALDARVVIHDEEMNEEDLPKPAIRPYPIQYSDRWQFPDGVEVNIRPIRSEDEPLMVRFHQSLSERSVFLRYFQSIELSQRVAHERLTRICFADYDREIPLVAEIGAGDEIEIIGVARLSRVHGRNEAQFALIVSDKWQGRGLGTELIRRTIDIARREKLERLTADVLRENVNMIARFEHMGFKITDSENKALLHVAMEL